MQASVVERRHGQRRALPRARRHAPGSSPSLRARRSFAHRDPETTLAETRRASHRQRALALVAATETIRGSRSERLRAPKRRLDRGRVLSCRPLNVVATTSALQPGAEPCVFTYTAYNDCPAAMNSRLRFGPPKAMFAQTSGRRMRPINLPSGEWTVTPL